MAVLRAIVRVTRIVFGLRNSGGSLVRPEVDVQQVGRVELVIFVVIVAGHDHDVSAVLAFSRLYLLSAGLLFGGSFDGERVHLLFFLVVDGSNILFLLLLLLRLLLWQRLLRQSREEDVSVGELLQHEAGREILLGGWSRL